MNTAYVLISDAHRARCFERPLGSSRLVELADFVSPHRQMVNQSSAGSQTGAASKGHGRTAHAGTQFEPVTSDTGKARAEFAQQLADYLNTSAAEHRYQSLVLIATGPMLGEIEPRLNPVAVQALTRRVAKDFTHFTGPELDVRVKRELETSA
jgi:protein required for attachment to host cells